MEDEQLRAEVRQLRERVKTLENEQSESDSGALTPTRRRLLGGAAGGTLGIAALLSASSPAAAADDQLGTPSTRIDFYGDLINANTLEAKEQTISDTGTDPSTNGKLRQNNGDLKAYSGGSVRNLSDIGSEWTKDGTLTAPGTTTASYTLNNTYPVTYLALDQWAETPQSASVGLYLRVNGDSSTSYQWIDYTGAKTTGDTGWRLWDSGEQMRNQYRSGIIQISVNGEFNIGMKNISYGPSRALNVSSAYQGSTGVTNDPPTSIEFALTDGSYTIDNGEVVIYGSQNPVF